MRAKIGLWAVLAVVLAGCGTMTVAPGSDPIVVYAEANAERALRVMDSFLKWERLNEVALLKLDPGIHRTAEEIRANGPRWIDELTAATRAYKASRTEPNRTALQAAQQFLDLVVAEMQMSLARGGGL